MIPQLLPFCKCFLQKNTEHATGHIPHSHIKPLYSVSLSIWVQIWNRSSTPVSFSQSGSRSAFLSFPLGNSPSFSSGSLCCPLHRSNDGTTRIFLPFSKVCTLPYSSPFRPECSGVSDIPASRLPQLCTRCKGFSLHTLSYTSYRTGGCLFKKNLQHFAFFEQQKHVPAKMQCTIFRTIILWEHVL